MIAPSHPAIRLWAHVPLDSASNWTVGTSPSEARRLASCRSGTRIPVYVSNIDPRASAYAEMFYVASLLISQTPGLPPAVREKRQRMIEEGLVHDAVAEHLRHLAELEDAWADEGFDGYRMRRMTRNKRRKSRKPRERRQANCC